MHLRCLILLPNVFVQTIANIYFKIILRYVVVVLAINTSAIKCRKKNNLIIK
jgi:hypothetical protein